MENWKRIGMYEVSDEGQVFSHYTGKILTGWKNHDGYVLVDLRIKKERKHFQVHRLVWETFVGKIPEGYELDHIDCNTGHVIREWDCSATAQRELGIWSSSILNCCKGRLKTTGGFKWRFAS